MSKPSTTTTGKRGRPRVKTPKSRQTITLEPSVLKTARKLACGDGLALSTWINRLIRERMATQTGAES